MENLRKPESFSLIRQIRCSNNLQILTIIVFIASFNIFGNFISGNRFDDLIDKICFISRSVFFSIFLIQLFSIELFSSKINTDKNEEDKMNKIHIYKVLSYNGDFTYETIESNKKRVISSSLERIANNLIITQYRDGLKAKKLSIDFVPFTMFEVSDELESNRYIPLSESEIKGFWDVLEKKLLEKENKIK
jgi:hypothetical protein